MTRLWLSVLLHCFSISPINLSETNVGRDFTIRKELRTTAAGYCSHLHNFLPCICAFARPGDSQNPSLHGLLSGGQVQLGGVITEAVAKQGMFAKFEAGFD